MSTPNQPPDFFAMRPLGRKLLVEATIALALASLTISVLPFRLIARLAAYPTPKTVPPDATRDLVCERVRWAILVSASHAPWKPLCFPQGLAAQWMLRRRNVPSVLYYGAAANAGAGLTAHVWVCDGEKPIIGGEAAAGLAVLARFPPDTLHNKQ